MQQTSATVLPRLSPTTTWSLSHLHLCFCLAAVATSDRPDLLLPRAVPPSSTEISGSALPDQQTPPRSDSPPSIDPAPLPQTAQPPSLYPIQIHQSEQAGITPRVLDSGQHPRETIATSLLPEQLIPTPPASPPTPTPLFSRTNPSSSRAEPFRCGPATSPSHLLSFTRTSLHLPFLLHCFAIEPPFGHRPPRQILLAIPFSRLIAISTAILNPLHLFPFIEDDNSDIRSSSSEIG